MPEDQLQTKLIAHLKTPSYRPQNPRRLAREMHMASEEHYPSFREALKSLMHAGRVVLGAGGSVMLPSSHPKSDEIIGTYRHNRRGFGFVVPSDPEGHEDLFIPEGENAGAITGDTVRAKITNREHRDGKEMFRGKIVEVIARSQKRFVGSLVKQHGQWLVLPDGNVLTDPILTPDAGSRHIKPGTKVVVELTTYPEGNERAAGVITEVLGQPGEKDVDLRSVIIQFNLPEEFPESCLDQARAAVDRFNRLRPADHPDRLDLSDRIICTIDPDDAKDYDDAISLDRLGRGQWELGVHIADVSFFVEPGSALDTEARERGNSVYFPGHVIPMLPEILSNGVCSLQGGVPRLCKSAFITLDESGHPISTRFANTIIRSAARLRYREAQAIIDNAQTIPHPEGPRSRDAYEPRVVQLLHDMNTLARLIQKRRQKAGQLVLELPEIDLLLDENGKVVGAEAEDTSFTHTLIEMFMVEANEAVARLLDSLNVPFLRRIHPEPETEDAFRLRRFVEVAGFELPKNLDRKALQALLASARGKPQSFAINLAVLKSLSRAEYSPKPLGHYALASTHYGHFTSPIRRYADLTIHRLLDTYLQSGGRQSARRGKKIALPGSASEADLVELGKHLSFTERQADNAEKELRQIKILELLRNQIGEDFAGVVTGITNFGIFVQLTAWLIDGLIRYEDLLDDWWEVDERGGSVRGQRTGQRIRIGDTCVARIVRVDPPRRELDLAITKLQTRPGAEPSTKSVEKKQKRPDGRRRKPRSFRKG